METEIWKDIPGWEGKYQVSSYGNVMSYKLNNPKLLSQFNNNKGYKIVHLYDKCICNPYQVHRLVAMAFLGLSTEKYVNHKVSLCVCHKDDNPSNNSVDNLFIGNQTENMRDMIRKGRGNQPSGRNHVFFGRRGADSHSFGKIGANSYSGKPVIQYSMEGVMIKEWCTGTEAANSLGICGSDISSVCHNKQKSAGGFKWKLKY